jgi:hypothetical protein
VPDRRAEGVVGVLQVGEGGVATALGDDHAGEDRPQRRVWHEGHVGVPGVVLVLVAVAGILTAAGGVDLEHLGVLGVERGQHGVGRRELTELPTQRHQLGGGQVLASEDEELVLGEGVVEGVGGPGAEGLAQVDAGHLGGEGAPEAGDRESGEHGGGGHGARLTP